MREMKILINGLYMMLGMLLFMLVLAVASILGVGKESTPASVYVSNIDELKASPSDTIIYIVCECDTPSNAENKAETRYTSLGEYKLTAYCSCSKCCGKWSGGNTASGTKPEASRTVAVDKSIISFGTKLLINGAEYIAEDTGAFKGKHIDIYMNDHNEALRFGVQYAEVFKYE